MLTWLLVLVRGMLVARGEAWTREMSASVSGNWTQSSAASASHQQGALSNTTT